MDLKDYIRDIPDFPEPGILFRDITPLLANPQAFDHAVAQLATRCSDAAFDAVVAVESRGFIFGAPLARELGKPLVPVRKPGKLPADTHSVEYDLEYGSNVLEIHSDGITPGQRVLIVDDLLAIGGTLSAASHLVEACGGEVVLLAVVIELLFLDGRSRLEGRELVSLIQY
ncbi:Adenine phosphoribosyltransferase [Geodia barretti]|uniref:Adenine phosphoribosyltransferase n=1 Tax=Geodia barretti TaxID=519541 RepID=A0AA35XA42_GEOBA|nr:Adenine phosphoribosyltransferase [Geodia barretti]